MNKVSPEAGELVVAIPQTKTMHIAKLMLWTPRTSAGKTWPTSMINARGCNIKVVQMSIVASRRKIAAQLSIPAPSRVDEISSGSITRAAP